MRGLPQHVAILLLVRSLVGTVTKKNASHIARPSVHAYCAPNETAFSVLPNNSVVTVVTIVTQTLPGSRYVTGLHFAVSEGDDDL